MSRESGGRTAGARTDGRGVDGTAPRAAMRAGSAVASAESADASAESADASAEPADASAEPPAGANKCFVCGPDNPIGLHLTFRLEDGACVSEFTPGENHQGYPGVIHGGMLYAVLDDVMANWLYLRGARAYTAKCEIRYRRPVREGDRLELVGLQKARKRKLVEMEGIARRASDGEVVAIANATFVVIDEEEFVEAVGA